MNNILSIKVADSTKRVFLQNGFYQHNMCLSPLHSHNYSEIHLVVRGKVKFFIENKEHIMNAGSILIIPPTAFHWVMAEDDDATRIAFQLEHTASGFCHKKISQQILCELENEISLAQKTNNYSGVSPYLSLVCCKLLDTETETPAPISDYAFLIYEFFSQRYNQDVQLSDLANELKLSERQTQRLVKKYTGDTFGSVLTKKRMALAHTLFEISDFSKSDICERVGYRSYGGFSKAYKKHTKE